MSANATNSSKRRMDCGRVAREEILEGYLMGRLNEEERDAFEEHYFECPRCFDELQTLRAIQGELQQRGALSEPGPAHSFRRWATAAGLAAALVLVVAVTLWMRPALPSGQPEATNAPTAPQTQSPETPGSQQPEAKVAPEPSLEELARVEPPRYEPFRLRGAPDEATERFKRGMERYRMADYAEAVEDLRAAAELDPDAAHIRFFLGISHLMLGQDNAAVDRLRATIALGDSPYLEDARLYLAKAYLRQRNLGAAETQLKRLIELGGSESGEARRLLAQVERLKQTAR